MSDEKPDDAKPPETKVNGVESADLVVPLRKAVIAHGDEVKELKFREPTAADIEACGSPVIFNPWVEEGQPKTRLETKNMFAMMSRLANVPPSTIKQMNTVDWKYAAHALAYRFFSFET